MDIGILGSQYLDNSRFSVDSLEISRRKAAENIPVNESTSTFAGLLEKAQSDAAAPTSNPRTPTSKFQTPNSHIDKTDKLYEQCEALETFLVKTLISGMRNTVQKSGLIDEGFAGKMYEDMLYDEYAKNMTKNAGFGLAELAYMELTGQRGKLISEHF
jgi:flagellar protein FlgJ